MRFGIEEMKNIPICDLFYRVALDTVGPLLETTSGNKYVLVAIYHYSKWCEVRPIKEHDAYIATKFLEDEVICKYGMPKYILTDNGNEWMKEFVEIYQNYGITHHFTTPCMASMQWFGGASDKDHQTWTHGYGYYQHT
jgi:hypothetical protein